MWKTKSGTKWRLLYSGWEIIGGDKRGVKNDKEISKRKVWKNL